MAIGNLTDAEVADFARRIAAADPLDSQLRDMLGDGVVTIDRLLFRTDRDLMTRSLLRELQWLDKQVRPSAPLSAYVAGDPPTPAVLRVRLQLLSN